ncbi:SDR family NAD(P)-dependent oxidoreductase [Mesorhizobium sp. LHD-90]|uniref:SDR family NAD(P)-dependent oxidoreductase n=1 Tax=Mesorhizobium sp. LHD-90 TaxID=3071414 RepID=UPI0027E1A374|nr:SDR family NAD(P)-dependent oxidoreductase [Mesorhizobium sp. LHD-90]MDQ6435364.1 SDR family NAD(P)-dependent oxidoreductase [Mesorhizobium sp. LHD-90]
MRADLSGQVVFITGAAGGIGRATAHRLAANGASIVVADIDADGAGRVAAELPSALAVSMDVRRAEDAKRAVDATLEKFGRIDVLINNAGVNSMKERVNIDKFSEDEWRRIVGIDLDGLYVVSHAALQPMVAHGHGRIVNIASVIGVAGFRLQSAFSAAKAGMIHLTRSMALELGPKGILVNSLAPGSVLTEGTKQLFYGDDGTFRAQMAGFMSHIPLGRPAHVEEIAEGILFLCAPENSYMTGHLMMVDGGWTAGFMF